MQMNSADMTSSALATQVSPAMYDRVTNYCIPAAGLGNRTEQVQARGPEVQESGSWWPGVRSREALGGGRGVGGLGALRPQYTRTLRESRGSNYLCLLQEAP